MLGMNFGNVNWINRLRTGSNGRLGISGTEPLGSNTRNFNMKQNYENCAQSKSYAFQRQDFSLPIFITVIFMQTKLSELEMCDMNKK
jgi:hypothetical protein